MTKARVHDQLNDLSSELSSELSSDLSSDVRNDLWNDRGLTLIELLIALFILSFIAVFTSESLQNSIKFKNRFQKNLDQEARAKTAMMMLERDIGLAFHSQDLVRQLNQQVASAQPNQAGQAAGQAPNQPPAMAFGHPIATPVGGTNAQKKPNWTQFWGDENKLSFTTRSNVRLNADAPESDLAEVGYEVKSCGNSLSNQGAAATNCLWRRSSSVIDDQIDQGGTEQVLLENVQEFTLRYTGVGKEDWDSKWYTDTRGDASTVDKFPSAVEIRIVTQEDRAGKAHPFELNGVAVIRFPNNEPLTSTATSGKTPGAAIGSPPTTTTPQQTQGGH